MSESKIGPCPFNCGEAERLNRWPKVWQEPSMRYSVHCICGGKGSAADTPEEAVAAWNRAGDTGWVYIVQYGNYEPKEVDTIWSTIDLAERRAAQLGDPWEVAQVAVNPIPLPPPPADYPLTSR